MTSIYVALIIYLVILFAVGIYYSKKNATISDFLLAGKSLGVIAATLTISASLFGGGLLTGTAQKAYNSDPMMYVYGIFGSGFGLLLASFLVKKMKDFSNFGTITEYLETRYNSKFLRSASAFLSMVALIALVGSQVGAAVGIMNALGMKNTTIAALFACIVIIALTSMGGLMAVTVTDGFQIILVMVGVVWITVAALGDIGGLSGLNASLTAIQSELPEGYNVFMDSEKFKSLLWMILPGPNCSRETSRVGNSRYLRSGFCNNRHEHPPWLGCWHYYCCGAFCYFFYSGLLPVGSRIALYD